MFRSTDFVTTSLTLFKESLFKAEASSQKYDELILDEVFQIPRKNALAKLLITHFPKDYDRYGEIEPIQFKIYELIEFLLQSLC